MLQKRIKSIFQKSFIRNVLLLVTGTAGAQLITVLVSPIITRLYGPEAFGIMGTFSAIANIIIPIAALTYPVAIVLPKKDNEAKTLIKLSISISMVLSIISLFIIILFHNQITNIFNLTSISNFLYLIPIVFIFAGFMQSAKQWLIRTNQFSINAKANFYQSVIINSSKVGIGLFYPAASVLVVLTTMINGIRAFIMIAYSKTFNIFFQRTKSGEKKNIEKTAKKYIDFPLYRAPESLLTGISHGMPVLMLTAFFGPASAGFYNVGRNVLSLPTQLIGEAVGDVFYPKIATAHRNQVKITKHIQKATFALAGIGIVPYGIVILFGPLLFSLVFGEEWVMAGEYARWIALWSFSNFINKPSTKSLAVLNAQMYHLMYTVFGLIVRISVLLIGFYIFKSDLVAVALFGSAGAILNIGLITVALYLSRKR